MLRCVNQCVMLNVSCSFAYWGNTLILMNRTQERRKKYKFLICTLRLYDGSHAPYVISQSQQQQQQRRQQQQHQQQRILLPLLLE